MAIWTVSPSLSDESISGSSSAMGGVSATRTAFPMLASSRSSLRMRRVVFKRRMRPPGVARLEPMPENSSTPRLGTACASASRPDQIGHSAAVTEVEMTQCRPSTMKRPSESQIRRSLSRGEAPKRYSQDPLVFLRCPAVPGTRPVFDFSQPPLRRLARRLRTQQVRRL
jgi:hypothetical protein